MWQDSQSHFAVSLQSIVIKWFFETTITYTNKTMKWMDHLFFTSILKISSLLLHYSVQ